MSNGDLCHICGERNKNVFEEHHLVPRRHGGSNSDENIVTLCANCHRALESIYDDAFWERAAAAIRANRDGPYVSNFTESEICNECLRRYNARIENDSDAETAVGEPQSPLYNDSE